ncbi:transposable element Tc1 transposase [Trichonephila clavipes]|nr:transposable element Tc1 transposase [Trichonephila clavipes]
MGSTSACHTILRSSSLFVVFLVAPDPVFCAWVPSRVHSTQQFLTAHFERSIWPATRHADQPAVFIPMIRPLSNSLNCEKCLLARLSGMFRLPKSSYNRWELVLAAGLSVERVKKLENPWSCSRSQAKHHRLQWCRAHRHWTLDMWKTVLWSDESRFSVWQLVGRVWVGRMPSERFFSDCIVPTVKFGGGSIMVWGCFSWFGLGPLASVIENMNTEMYVDIMDNAALPTLWQYFGEGPLLFQQDNCSIHTSRLAQTWFDEMGVQKLDCPSQSPDLNPIEHLWDELERRLRSQPNRPSSLQALTSAVMDAWKAIPMITYQKLVKSLPERVQAVLHAKGGSTSY